MADSKLVYSTGPQGPQDVKPKEEPQQGGLPPLKQRIKVRRETAARGGKTVTALWDFQASERQLEELAKALKKALGVGGSAKDGRVEIQGDKVVAVLAWLEKAGYKPVKAGG
jgi:translation initiation factor 1